MLESNQTMRTRLDEIEFAITQGMTASACFTQMKQLIDLAQRQGGMAEAMTLESAAARGFSLEKMRGWNACRDAMLAAAPPAPSPVDAVSDARFDLLAHLPRLREWSERTFGTGDHTFRICDHLRKEIDEVEDAYATDKPTLPEWVDVVMAALDGAWRAGHDAAAIASALQAKQAKNESRTWPDWRTADHTKAIEHVRGGENAVVDAAPSQAAADEAMDRIMTYAKELRASDAAGEAANWQREYDELMSRKPEGADSGEQDVEALAQRLIAHADMHANVSPHDDEQAQWESDLRDAARRLTASAAVKQSLTVADQLRGATKLIEGETVCAHKPNVPETPDGSLSEHGGNLVYGIIDPDYARIFTIARCLAWAEGYAIAMHGSLTRDLDLIATPWAERACEPQHLVNRIIDAAGLREKVDNPGQKPHGRLVWTLHLPGFGEPRWIDLSITPRAQRGDDREDAERWREVDRRYDASKTQDAVAVLRGLGLEETPYRSFAENIDAARAATHDSAGGA